MLEYHFIDDGVLKFPFAMLLAKHVQPGQEKVFHRCSKELGSEGPSVQPVEVRIETCRFLIFQMYAALMLIFW